jgi:parallel beta-helix repeat protein
VGSLALWIAVPAPAHAATEVVHCGEVITHDVTVANDLINCPRHGLVIGAANITLDLNGHTIDGDGTLFDPCPVDEPCNSGIANSGLRNGLPINGSGFPGVTVKNGLVREFAEGGVYITGTHDNVVHGVRTSTSAFESGGVHFRDCTHCVIEDSTADNFSIGFAIERSNDVRVSGNQVHDNEFGGIGVFMSRAVTIAGNVVHDTANGDGIVVFHESSGNVVRANVAYRNLGGIGVADESDNTRVIGNIVHDNQFVGVYVVGGTRNAVAGNAIYGNGDGSEGGIHVVNDPAATDTVVSGNATKGNRGDGILVDKGSQRTLIDGNGADSNTDDGIDVDSAATTIRRNTANNNGDFGIDAVRGVTDGGGNHATGNGNPKQCRNVSCA